MLRCFDCNTAADDARTLVENGTWTSSSGPASLQQTVVTEERSMLSTEYRLKFQDFSGGSAPPSDASCPDGGVRGLGRAKTWYSDLLESRRKAVTYKVRGWGKESAPSHLVYLYDQAEDPSRPPEKKIISALYLETLQPGLSRGRTPVPDRSRAGTADSTDGRGRTAAAVSRPLPPPAAAAAAARKASAKAAMKLPINERKPRPGNAHRVRAKTPGDEVDGVSGRSPSGARPPAAPPRRKSPGPRPGGPLRVAAGPEPSADGQERGRPVAVRRPPAGERPPTAAAAGGAPAESPAAAREALAALMKSPPEPTRVRSPETSAALRSPEAVNWTLPLDTARAFTVTQNVGGGQSRSARPRSSHSTSSGQSQISPLHRQLLTEAMAARAEPPPPALYDGHGSPTPPLVRPADAPPAGDSGQQNFTDRPPGARLFSAGSAAPAKAAVVEMSGAGKPAVPVRADGREAPQYHVI
ncbi:translation initiation factor IF-2-like [Amphibalanus amphitrite]|uniref:translation initiation factor IF-2-like n=1 Tax=Amphibalanus amphitrite TaxID=1232801 RepID=UPI001C900882|nr:translation initiation factor IF-2-like [Amphibalanus amphitrite]